MNKSKVVSLKGISFFEFFVRNKTILILCLIFSVGVIFGTFSYAKSAIAENLAGDSLTRFLEQRQGKSFIAIVGISMISSLLNMLCCYLGGASLMGIILVPLFICLRGFWYGSLSALLYSEYALKGVAFNAVVILLPLLISLISLIFAARESIAFSYVLSSLTLPRSRPLNLHIDFKNYSGRYILLCSAVLISAFVDALLSRSFLHFFDFG